MNDYFNATGPALMAAMLDPRQPLPLPVPDIVTDSAVFDFSSWDVALAHRIARPYRSRAGRDDL